MSTLKTRDGVKLYTKSWGTGRPVLLIHGWPLTADSWDDIAIPLAEAGFRAVAYDRRGFGRSEQTWEGYDYDSLSDDLADVISGLKLNDVTVAGFSMGGGEVARYMSRHKAAKLRSAVLISSVVPFMLKTEDNPNGVPQETFDEMKQGIRQDRPKFFSQFIEAFYGVGMLSNPVSPEWLEWTRSLAMQASLKATLDCVDSFATTDFRSDLASFKVPTLLIHGTGDQIVPIDTTSRPAAAAVADAKLIEYEDAPHGLTATHREKLINDLIQFCQQ